MRWRAPWQHGRSEVKDVYARGESAIPRTGGTPVLEKFTQLPQRGAAMSRTFLGVGVGIALVLAACSDLEGTADVRALKAAVAPLHLDDPARDVRANVAHLDFRPIGLRDHGICTGYTGTDARLVKLQARLGTRCLRGGDAPPRVSRT